MDFDNLNSATKYPAIETFHALGDRGRLLDARTTFDGIGEDDEVIWTEKVDGTNIRVVVMPDGDYFIGIREELVHAKGDRIISSAVDGAIHPVLPVADRISSLPENVPYIQVFFMEVYGGKIGSASKNYTSQNTKALRLFDVAFLEPHILTMDRASIASWRDHGGQSWAVESTLQRAAETAGIQVTPRLGTALGSEIPTGLDDTYKWLQSTLPKTLVALDEDAAARPEGIVLRTKDRSRIAKARFQDYARTLEPQPSRKKK
jgi:hypothetical protein